MPIMIFTCQKFNSKPVFMPGLPYKDYSFWRGCMTFVFLFQSTQLSLSSKTPLTPPNHSKLESNFVRYLEDHPRTRFRVTWLSPQRPGVVGSLGGDSNYLLTGMILQVNHRHTILAGGFNPSEKYSSNWKSSPNRGKNKKYLKPPPSILLRFATTR